MTVAPLFFEPIRQKESRRWDLLLQDLEMSGPWFQLFRQVQSPRHVLSELLQNADDAGATEARVRVEDGVFLFEHNGEDFAEEHFASLCRFGYSNKRTLHTIGFRGIGFKSTFSLGECVEVHTPTLAVSFRYPRFTEPVWLSENGSTGGKTCIRVSISDEHRRTEVAKNLADWVKSPLSLLFFRSIRRIQVGEDEVHWLSLKDGPVPDSQWMALRGQEDERFLFVRSAAEEFPAEALGEIRQERMVTIQEEADFPPSRVEIVLGAPGRLFVVLPTGIETKLPFACNAPFIQDPARDKIKDPSISPTNRWLLQRAGRLAASTMLAWLSQSNMPIGERARAYGLLPDVDRDDNSPEGVCATLLEEAFDEETEDKRILLTENGSLAPAKQAIVIPEEIVSIWPANRCAKILDEAGRPALSPHVGDDDLEKLLNWELVEELTKEQFLEILQSKHLPKPVSWRGLLKLWAYIAPEITGNGFYRHWPEHFRIVPVQGQGILYSTEEVVRLGEKKLLQSEDDWRFLAEYLLVMNQNWTRFLAKQNRDVDSEDAKFDQEDVEAAYTVLQRIGLAEASDLNKVIAQVVGKVFSQDKVNLHTCVRLAQIAAKFGATVGNAFHYVTRDVVRRPPSNHLHLDLDGTLQELIPDQQRDSHLLHDEYLTSFRSCTRDEWQDWIASRRSGLLSFIPLCETSSSISGREEVESAARSRGLQGGLRYTYESKRFIIKDWDFPPGYWEHWDTLAAQDEAIWGRIAQRFLLQGADFWKHAKSAQVVQVSQCDRKSTLRTDLLPNWVLRFRELKCLPDTHGILRKPGELLRRTPETEALLDAEPFLRGDLDNEASRALLDLLGVRSEPTGPDRILDCLRALAKAERPPGQEVDKWYRRLDQLFDSCLTSDTLKIKAAFSSERLILTSDGEWENTAGVFLAASDEDAPGAALVRPSVEELALWRKIGVEGRPTAELALKWLKKLVSGQSVPREDVDRVKALLGRHPVRIWEECGHWLNLAGQWVPTDQLRFALTMQSLTRWQHLHPWVKNATADLQRLHGEVASSRPFSALPTLASVVEDRLRQDLTCNAPAEKRAWMTVLGTELCRVVRDRDEETQRVRSLGERLAHTGWQSGTDLEIIPYIDGTPAGTARPAEVVWLGKTLYTGRVSRAKLAKLVPDEIGKVFGDPDIKAALSYGYERSAGEIQEYLEENFTLARPEDVPQPESVPPAETVAEDAPTDTDEDADRRVEGVSAGAGGEAHEPASREVGPPQEGDSCPAPSADLPSDTPERDSRPAVKDRIARPEQPGILERFAAARGFSKDGDDRFFHEDGSWIARVRGEIFPWHRHAASGDVVQYYWPKDHCLKQSPLQLEAEVWWLIKKHPENHSLILADLDGEPLEVTGTELCEMCNSEEIVLHPATYRLVYGAGGTDH